MGSRVVLWALVCDFFVVIILGAHVGQANFPHFSCFTIDKLCRIAVKAAPSLYRSSHSNRSLAFMLPLALIRRWSCFIFPRVLVPAARAAALCGRADGGGDGARSVGAPRQLLRPDFVPTPAGRGAKGLLLLPTAVDVMCSRSLKRRIVKYTWMSGTSKRSSKYNRRSRY